MISTQKVQENIMKELFIEKWGNGGGSSVPRFKDSRRIKDDSAIWLHLEYWLITFKHNYISMFVLLAD